MRILFLGYDARYEIVINTLKNKYDVYTVGYEVYEGVKKGKIDNLNIYDIVVLPIRGVKSLKEYNVDNNILKDYKGVIYTGIKDGIENNVVSFLDDDEICLENTLISVEGIIDKIKNIKKDVICILGYGKIGSRLYNILKDKYKVYIGVKNKDDLNLENSYLTSDQEKMKDVFLKCDLIINTVPDHIISEDILKSYKGKFLDIASYPYAIDQESINNYPFTYQQYLSIPSKYDKNRAGKILLKKF